MKSQPIRVAVGLTIFLAAIGGCTMRPKSARSNVPSFDATGQNSGFVGYDLAGNGMITETALARYNALIVQYGARFPIPLTPDYGVAKDGVTNSVQLYTLTPDGVVKFREMNVWRLNKIP